MADLFNGVDNDSKMCAVWVVRVCEFRGGSNGRDTKGGFKKNFGGKLYVSTSLSIIDIFLGQVQTTAPFWERDI